MKIYILTKHEDAALVDYQRDDSQDDRGDFEGIVVTIYGLVFTAPENARSLAQEIVDVDFGPVSHRAVPILWDSAAGYPTTGVARLDGPKGPMVLSFGIREQELEPADDEVYLVGLREFLGGPEDDLNTRAAFATLDEAKEAVRARLGLTAEEMRWGHLTGAALWETQLDRPGTPEMVIIGLKPWVGPLYPDDVHAAAA